MTPKKKERNTGPNPSNKYKCIRFNSKYHNLWTIKVNYKDGESHCSFADNENVDQSTAHINKPVAVHKGGGEEVVDSNRLRTDRFADKIRKRKARAAIQKGDLKKSRGLVTKLEDDIAKERSRFERVLAQQMVRVRAEKDAEYETERLRFENEKRALKKEMTAVIAEKDIGYNKLADTLAETRKNLDGVKRQNWREKEKVKKLVWGSLVNNV